MKIFNFDKTVPYIKRKGVLRLVQLIYHNFFDLVLLNLTFVITSVPVFTIGASYKALVCVLSKLIEDEQGFKVCEYFKAFGSRFLKSTLYSGFFSLLFTIIAFASVFYYNLAKQNVIFYFVSILCFACLFVLLMMTCWFFPLYAKTNQGFTGLMVNSFILAFAEIKKSLFYLVVVFICAFVVLAFLPYSLPAVFIFPFSFTALASVSFSNDKITENFKLN